MGSEFGAFAQILQPLLKGTGKTTRRVLEEDEQSRFVKSSEGGSIQLKCNICATLYNHMKSSTMEDYREEHSSLLPLSNRGREYTLSRVWGEFASISSRLPRARKSTSWTTNTSEGKKRAVCWHHCTQTNPLSNLYTTCMRELWQFKNVSSQITYWVS